MECVRASKLLRITDQLSLDLIVGAYQLVAESSII